MRAHSNIHDMSRTPRSQKADPYYFATHVLPYGVASPGDEPPQAVDNTIPQHAYDAPYRQTMYIL